jgi:hypothetical protein
MYMRCVAPCLTDIDQRDGRSVDGIEHLRLVVGVAKVDDLGDVLEEALQASLRALGVERADRKALSAEIVQHDAGQSGLADASLVCADDHDGRLFRNKWHCGLLWLTGVRKQHGFRRWLMEEQEPAHPRVARPARWQRLQM